MGGFCLSVECLRSTALPCLVLISLTDEEILVYQNIVVAFVHVYLPNENITISSSFQRGPAVRRGSVTAVRASGNYLDTAGMDI